ncbi:MAG TPA: ABC transporter permease [Gemmatimonadaceae bacterium]|nr:ABC transporter permease [Gemmatimonadaceae bacterium]
MRHALRRLRATPMFTIAATLTLAIAIGATASVFSVVDGVLLKAFPYRDPNRVLMLNERNDGLHQPRATVAAANYFVWAAQNRSFTGLAATCCAELWSTVVRAHDAERVETLAVTANYFQVLGVTPILGRTLAADTSGPNEVVISHAYWQRRFGGAPSVIGQPLTLDNGNDARKTPRHTYTIVGVMPAGLPVSADMWTLIYFEPDENTDFGYRYLDVYGRLAPGVTLQGARAELATVADRLALDHPKDDTHWSIVATPLLDAIFGPVRPALIMLLAAAACVLVIGAANLANLFLVRCLAREREMAVRTALGATRGRLIRDLAQEATLLSLVAGALGIAVAYGGVRALRALAPPTLPRLAEVGIDVRVVAFCALASMATVFVFGLFPAWQVSRGSLAARLKEGGRGTGSAQQHRLQNGLAVLQISIALVLLTGAGLLVAGFVHFQRVDPGFRPEGILTARVTLSRVSYQDRDKRHQFFADLVERLSARPEIESASESGVLPAQSRSQVSEPFTILGDPPPDPRQAPTATVEGVNGDYFRTMGIKLLHGRTFLPIDDPRSRHVGIVNDVLAQRYFAGRDPIGLRVSWYSDHDTLEIVGVVASIKASGLAADATPGIYISVEQRSPLTSHVEVRARGNPKALARIVTATVASLDPSVPVSEVETMDEIMMQSIGLTRFSSFLASLFAVVALVLGVVGIYSVLAYIVSQRQREMAVRLALGASHSRLVGGVVRRALELTALGILVGSSAAWMLTRALSALFLGVSPHDPLIFLGAATTFVIVALVAAIVPSIRTTRVSPVSALTA